MHYFELLNKMTFNPEIPKEQKSEGSSKMVDGDRKRRELKDEKEINDAIFGYDFAD